MNGISQSTHTRFLHFFLWGTTAAAAFHVASSWKVLAPLMILFFFCLNRSMEQGCPRHHFYLGLAVGMAIYSWQLRFFFQIFSMAALVLWLILSLWVALFMLLSSHYRRTYPLWLQTILITCTWMALEYTRGELYYLRFTWSTPGMAFASCPGLSHLSFLGIYGLSGLCCLLGSMPVFFSKTRQSIWIAGSCIVLSVCMHMPTGSMPPSLNRKSSLNVGGLHLNQPGSPEGLKALNAFLKRHPDTDLIVLAEYSFFGPPPAALRNWCRTHNIHMVVGGTQNLENDNYKNTAYVISSTGELIFKQVKSVPIQFFNDGLPAEEQAIWQSPWGPVGICICYDLSYTRVTDALVRKGAGMILVPTLDELHWGRSQHEFHALIAPTRAAEYQIPVVRVGACGISQVVDFTGKTKASTPFPGEHATVYTSITPVTGGRLPWDRTIVWLCLGVIALECVYSLLSNNSGFKKWTLQCLSTDLNKKHIA